MQRLAGEGVQVLVPPDGDKRKGTRPGWDGGLYAFMRRVLETEAGGALYRKRQAMIEPVFANTKFNRRIDRFLRRGRSHDCWRTFSTSSATSRSKSDCVAVTAVGCPLASSAFSVTFA